MAENVLVPAQILVFLGGGIVDAQAFRPDRAACRWLFPAARCGSVPPLPAQSGKAEMGAPLPGSCASMASYCASASSMRPKKP
jgi:hypothetical protein